MDLGVAREAYDLNMRRQLEKDREIELKKKQVRDPAFQQILGRASHVHIIVNPTLLLDPDKSRTCDGEHARSLR